MSDEQEEVQEGQDLKPLQPLPVRQTFLTWAYEDVESMSLCLRR